MSVELGLYVISVFHQVTTWTLRPNTQRMSCKWSRLQMLVLGQAQQSQTGGVGQSRTALYNKHSQI